MKKTADANAPAFVTADAMYYNAQEKLTIAKGNVRIVQDQRILMADEVRYYLSDNLVKARGHISLLEPTGVVYFADEVELRDDLKTGAIEHFRARLEKNTLVAADSAERVDENVTRLTNMTYSPCPLCKEDPTKAPLWQLKAKRATIDQKEQEVTYSHMFVEGMGTPIFYTPTFSHSTPGADNKSGLLTPEYRHSSAFGSLVRVPYFYTIAPNMDTTLTPTFSSSNANIYQGEFRHLTEDGSYKIRGSVTNPKKVNNLNKPIGKEFWRGHGEANGRFTFSDDWDVGFDARRASDKEYLRKYDFGGEDTLTSQVFAETAKDNNYTVVRSLSFQGLRSTDDPRTTPLILPQVDMHLESERGDSGDYWTLDNNVMALSRRQGADSRRVSSKAEWVQPYIHDSGSVFELRTSMRGDAYQVHDVPDNLLASNSRNLNGAAGRAIPQADLGWRLPMVRERDDFLPRLFLEPIWNGAISPIGGNPHKIPNEDSRSVEFSDDNLFNTNHFSGLDRVESGPRSNYGVRGAAYTESMGSFNGLFGQNLRMKEDSNFPAQSGLNDRTSDYVARIGYRAPEILETSYRTRLDKDNLEPHRHDVNATLTYDPVTLSANYLFLDQKFAELVAQNPIRKELYNTGSVAITDEWAFNGYLRRDLQIGKLVGEGYGLVYNGPCLVVSLSWNRDFTHSQELSPTSNIALQVTLPSLSKSTPSPKISDKQGLCTNDFCY